MAIFTAKDSGGISQSLDAETIGNNLSLTHSVKAIKNGGVSPYRNLDLGVTGAVVDVANTQIYGGSVFNAHASALRYLKIYDLATTPTESNTPRLTIPLPAQQHTKIGEVAVGLLFPHGLSLRATTGVADSDTGAPTSGDVIVNLLCASLGPTVTGVVGTSPAAGIAPVVTG